MPEVNAISTQQLKRLQTLYSQLASSDAAAKTREQRLLWASLLCNRTIASFSELTADEAKRAIDLLEKSIPEDARQRYKLQSGARRARKRRMDHERARRHGIDGRYDGEEFRDAPQLAQGVDLEVIESYSARLGWSRETFDAWLRSPRSPLRPSKSIRTVRDANRVRWALVHMLKARGLWLEKNSNPLPVASGQ
jgi:hypothetical protein